MSNLTDIDRLIEEGLMLYGQGDLDGALHAWEQALLIDPDNAQATSYVDYVRQHYALLTDGSVAEQDARAAPFGIADDDPEYQIEILSGEELPAAIPQVHVDAVDAGWDIEPEELPRAGQGRRATSRAELEEPAPLEVPLDLGLPMPGVARVHSSDAPEVTLELEADDPDAHATVATRPISFDDETREYPGGPPAKRPTGDRVATVAERPRAGPELEIELSSFGTTPPPNSELPEFHTTPDPITSEFKPDGPTFSTETPPGGFSEFTPTTSGFGSQVTDIRKRSTGFVQPVSSPSEDSSPRAKTDTGDLDNDTTFARPNAGLGLGPAGKRARRPSQIPPGLKMTLRSPGDPEPDDRDSEDDGTVRVALSYDDPQRGRAQVMLDPLADELITSLPSPRTPPYPNIGKNTMDMPPMTRTPADTQSPGTKAFPAEKTDKLPNNAQFALLELTEPPTRDLAGKIPAMARELVGAPTRDLGLRAAASALAGRAPVDPPPPTDEEPTTLRRQLPKEGTSADVILPFDPIDARSAEILDEVDVDVPKLESKEDRTRRRITRLFERSVEWHAAGDLDRAVAAIDLAMSEDPNSALAQKLIHRNRETMMIVFQAFLGDLSRQPMLARPLHELATAPISPRAAFLLSRIDGTLSLDEILDVSGMPRIEAFRYLCQLFLRNILR